MTFKLFFTKTANKQLIDLENYTSQAKRFKAVCKSLTLLQSNPKHPSLNTHQYYSIKGQSGEKILESYAENKTPAAYRIFWHYGPNKNVITIVAIVPHP